ncbi:hypothetical protein FOL47_008603 [Perkinsus chesapeaki]|uniref:C3H1-type domain-containing protein n=1 Tax=Perkinsus chesapeaki TaxID=330153 RepID=A0A7J6MTD2_PERCH|nr:hypothetical protein FOL47_008603 [Perkinsus chesapeaki]
MKSLKKLVKGHHKSMSSREKKALRDNTDGCDPGGYPWRDLALMATADQQDSRLSPNKTRDVHITTRIDFAEAERRIRQLTESQDPAVQGHQAFLKKCPAIPEDMQGDKLVQAAAKVPTDIALEMIKQVPSVNRVRYRLVPARIKEDDFWQRYFYAIFLIYRDETCWDNWSDIDLDAAPHRKATTEYIKRVPASDSIDGSATVLGDDQLLLRFHRPHQLASLLSSVLRRTDLNDDPRILRKLEDKIYPRLLGFSHVELSDLLLCYARCGRTIGSTLAEELWSIITDELEYMEASVGTAVIRLALATCGPEAKLTDEHWARLSVWVAALEPRDVVSLATAVGQYHCSNGFLEALRDKAGALISEGSVDDYQQVQLSLSCGSPLPRDCAVAPWLQMTAAVAWGLPLPAGSLETVRAASLRATAQQAQEALWAYVGICETIKEEGNSDLAAVLHRRSETAEWADPLMKFQTVVGIRDLWGVNLAIPAKPYSELISFSVAPELDGWRSNENLCGYRVDTYNSAKAIACDVTRSGDPKARAFARVKATQLKRLTGVTLMSFPETAELIEPLLLGLRPVTLMPQYGIRNTFIHLEKKPSVRRSKSCDAPKKDSSPGDDSCSESGVETARARRSRRLSASPRKVASQSAPSETSCFEGGYSVVMTLARSVGSLGHSDKQCRPCAFYYSKGCTRGSECMYCHDCPPPPKESSELSRMLLLNSAEGILGTKPSDVQQQQHARGLPPPQAHQVDANRWVPQPFGFIDHYDPYLLPFAMHDAGDYYNNSHMWHMPAHAGVFNDASGYAPPMYSNPFSYVRQ